MRNGLYKVEFGARGAMGAGVVTLRDGAVGGGDSSIYYVGTYQISGNTFTGQIRIARHTVGLPSVLGVDNATVNLRGTFHGDMAKLTGTTPEAPGVSLQATLSRLPD